MTDKLNRGWISNINKAQLVVYLIEFKVKPEKLCEPEFIKNGNHREETIECLLDPSQKHARSPLPIPNGIGNQPKGHSTQSSTPNATEMHQGNPVPNPQGPTGRKWTQWE